MSQIYSDYGAKYTIFAGTKKGFTSTIIDPTTGRAADLTNNTVYSSGTVDIVDSSGSVIFNAIVSFDNRAVNTSFVSWIAGPFTNLQAGNIAGYLKIFNINGDIVDQQRFNFVIIESF